MSLLEVWLDSLASRPLYEIYQLKAVNRFLTCGSCHESDYKWTEISYEGTRDIVALYRVRCNVCKFRTKKYETAHLAELAFEHFIRPEERPMRQLNPEED